MPKANAMFLHLEPGDYVCFIDRSSVDIQSFVKTVLPEGVSMSIIPLNLQPGLTITDAVLVEKADALSHMVAKAVHEKA